MEDDTAQDGHEADKCLGAVSLSKPMRCLVQQVEDVHFNSQQSKVDTEGKACVAVGEFDDLDKDAEEVSDTDPPRSRAGCDHGVVLQEECWGVLLQ